MRACLYGVRSFINQVTCKDEGIHPLLELCLLKQLQKLIPAEVEHIYTADRRQLSPLGVFSANEYEEN
jgi:hypothetical protein